MFSTRHTKHNAYNLWMTQKRLSIEELCMSNGMMSIESEWICMYATKMEPAMIIKSNCHINTLRHLNTESGKCFMLRMCTYCNIYILLWTLFIWRIPFFRFNLLSCLRWGLNPFYKRPVWKFFEWLLSRVTLNISGYFDCLKVISPNKTINLNQLSHSRNCSKLGNWAQSDWKLLFYIQILKFNHGAVLNRLSDRHFFRIRGSTSPHAKYGWYDIHFRCRCHCYNHRVTTLCWKRMFQFV